MKNPKNKAFSQSNEDLASSVSAANWTVEKMVDQAFQAGAEPHEIEFGRTCRLMFELDLMLGSQHDDESGDESLPDDG